MLTISARALALAAAVAVSASPASAQDHVIPDAAQVEQLCPQIGSNAFKIGAVETGAQWSALRAIEAQAPAPLSDASLVYTSWSNRLAAIRWEGPGFEGMEHFAWLNGVSQALEAAGWQLHGEGDGLFEAVEYRKAIATADGQRTFAVQLTNHGNFELTCGDAALLDLSAAEAVGDLADGSPRPVPPPPEWATEADNWLARFDCDNNALLAQFAALTEQDQTAGAVIASIGEPPGLSAESDYQRRLSTWLRWTIRNSGKVSEEDFGEIEDRAVSYNSTESAEDMTDFIMTAAALIEAEKAGDGKGRCTATRAFFSGARASGEREAIRTARANAIRIEEARKLGIAVD